MLTEFLPLGIILPTISPIVFGGVWETQSSVSVSLFIDISQQPTLLSTLVFMCGLFSWQSSCKTWLNV